MDLEKNCQNVELAKIPFKEAAHNLVCIYIYENKSKDYIIESTDITNCNQIF